MISKQQHNTVQIPLTVIFIVITFFVVMRLFLGMQTSAFSKPLRFVSHFAHKSICDIRGTQFARCHARVATDTSGTPAASATPLSTSYGPEQFHVAYNLPCQPGGVVASTCGTPASGFGPQTIAIVDAYLAPTIENDLTVYSNNYGLPVCTQANGCLKIVNQNGGTSLPLLVDSGWALETSLDVEVAHTICQTCKIVLVETNSSRFSDLATGVVTAGNLGATAISNSYGGSEWSSEASYDTYYSHPGVAIVASAGDSGYGVSYPAASKNVVAVGGTSLQIHTDNTYASESVWNGTGSGCSSYEQASSWQTSLSMWSLTGCGTKRGLNDVAADADPNTGAAVYDSTPYSGGTGWYQVGGTSLSSPIIAGVYALTGGVDVNINPVSLPYLSFTSGNSHDITSGSNGSCSTLMCTSTIGYDGPTGLGTPYGLTGFVAPVATATPTVVTPTSTNTPTPSVTPTIILSPTISPTPTPIDTIPPQVTITSPLANAFVTRFTKVTITANASDNVGVASVTFSVNNTLLCTKTVAPYSCTWNVPGTRRAQYTITVRAADAADNTTASSITVFSR